MNYFVYPYKELILKRNLLILLCLSFIQLQAFAGINVSDLQAKLHSSKAQWSAKHNWLTELPKDQLKNLLGNNEIIKSKIDYSSPYSKSYTYETVDWRNKDGLNWLGPVLNQGNCGSCVAFATVATLEAQVSISSGTPWLKPQFSTQALFACGGGACKRGWMTGAAASYVKRAGVVDNACAPYTMGSDGQDVSCREFCQNQSGRTYKVLGYNSPSGVFNTPIQKIKDALKKGPLLTSMTVYEDFIAYSGGIYKSVSYRSVGGHAVSLVGYNDQERYWIVRNSWGQDWGENGFVRISWDDKSGVGASSYGFDIGAESNTISIASPTENEYVSGEVKVKIQSASDDQFSVNVLKNGKIIHTLTGENDVLNTLNMEDGKYELMATSSTNPSLKSLVRGFTVSNHKPEITIDFNAHGNVNLGSPVKDRIEFDVNVHSTPIQLQKIDFMVTKLDGTLVAKRTTEVVLNKMLLGFRFNSIPDGEYLIFYRGYLPAGGKLYTVDSEKIKITNKNL